MMNAVESACSEDRYLALGCWWERHNAIFSEWFLKLSAEDQKATILKGSPDMPEKTPGSREAAGASLNATDMILPELSQEALLSVGGKLLVLLLTRRCVSKDLCFQQDVLFLHEQLKKGVLPFFADPSKIGQFDTPFIDPMDSEENMRSLSPATTPESRAKVAEYLDCGRLVHAQAWMALKLRRASIVRFMEKLIDVCEEACIVKPVPTFTELLRGELEMQAQLVGGVKPNSGGKSAGGADGVRESAGATTTDPDADKGVADITQSLGSLDTAGAPAGGSLPTPPQRPEELTPPTPTPTPEQSLLDQVE